MRQEGLPALPVGVPLSGRAGVPPDFLQFLRELGEVMSLKFDLITNEEKRAALGSVLDDLRVAHGTGDPTYMALKGLMNDLNGRIALPRSNALGEIERSLQRTYATRVGRSYDVGQLTAVANTLMKHWPVIRQALEHFGEISAE